MNELDQYIRNIPNFPKLGIQFKDLTTLFANPVAFKICLDRLEETYKGQDITKIIAVEARGFILGAPLADRLGIGFIPVRKKGKLPWNVIRESYDLEYGTDELEIHIDALSKEDSVIIIDDLIATGGTLEATITLIEKLGAKVVGIGCVVELNGLNGRERVKNYPLFSLIKYDEN